MEKLKKGKNTPLLVGINSKYIHPAVGIYLLKANCYYEVDILEFTIKDNLESILEKINDYKIIGFSVYIWNVLLVKKLLEKLDNKIIILGGPEASYNLDLFNYNINYIIKGEGEISFNKLLDYLNSKIPLSEVPNLYYKENNEIKYTFNQVSNLFNINHNFDIDYTNKIMYLESNRGCFFNCSYCLASLDKPVRYFPLDEVLENVSKALKNNLKCVKFLDRNFFSKPSIANIILEYIITNDNLITTFQFEVNIEFLKEETINLLKKSRLGQIRFEVGIQSTLDKSNKEINRIQNNLTLFSKIEAVRDFVIIHSDLIFGLPYETLTRFKETFNTTFYTFPNELQLGILKELKGSKLSLNKEKYGYVFDENPPYAIKKNNLVDESDIKTVEFVSLGLDLLYNNNNYKNTVNYVFKENKIDPFEVFKKIGQLIKPNMQLDEYFKIIYEVLKNYFDNAYLLFILKKDYLY